MGIRRTENPIEIGDRFVVERHTLTYGRKPPRRISIAITLRTEVASSDLSTMSTRNRFELAFPSFTRSPSHQIEYAGDRHTWDFGIFPAGFGGGGDLRPG